MSWWCNTGLYWTLCAGCAVVLFGVLLCGTVAGVCGVVNLGGGEMDVDWWFVIQGALRAGLGSEFTVHLDRLGSVRMLLVWRDVGKRHCRVELGGAGLLVVLERKWWSGESSDQVFVDLCDPGAVGQLVGLVRGWL